MRVGDTVRHVLGSMVGTVVKVKPFIHWGVRSKKVSTVRVRWSNGHEGDHLSTALRKVARK